MSQQINLYTPPAESNIWRDYRPFPQVGVAILSLLLLVYLVFLGRYWTLQDELQGLQSRQQASALHVQQVGSTLPQPVVDAGLENAVWQLESRLAARQNLLKVLGAQKSGNDAGFSHYLEGLAKRTVEGLWLTKIDLFAGGAMLGLQGKTSKPEFVPLFLRSLRGERVFEGAQFDIFRLAQEQAAGAPMSFDVRAAAGIR